MLEQSDIHDVVVELRLLRAEFEHIVEQNQATGKVMAEVFERLRAVENSIAVLRARQPQRANAWAMARAAQRWNIELPLEYGINVFGHKDVSKSATACPGTLDIKAIVKRANDIITANPTPQPQPATPTVDVQAIAEHLDAISAILKASK